MFSRIKEWRSRKNKDKSEEIPELREFIYLDEVSVTSLLSSRLGAIPNEFKDTVTDSTTAEINAQIQADALVAKSRVGSKLQAVQTANRQIVRKATIQATFKDLYDRERQQLVIRPSNPNKDTPTTKEVDSLLKSPEEKQDDLWLIQSNKLKRGRLAELAVELEADPIFRVSNLISTFGTLFKESKTLSSQVGEKGLHDISEANYLLEQLMVGLIPIKCRLLDYAAVTIKGKEFLIRKDALKKSMRQLKTKPIFITGVTEQGLFWKDIRRVLFSKAHVRVLCRLNDNGLGKTWTPVKLVDALGEIAPDLAGTIDNLGGTTLQVMRDEYAGTNQSKAPSDLLLIYSHALSNQGGVDLTDEDKLALNEIATAHAPSMSSIIEGRKGFDVATEYLSSRFGDKIPSDPEVLLSLREQARDVAATTSSVDNKQSNEPRPKDSGCYIDAEIVAIYW